MNDKLKQEFESRYPLTAEQIAFYRKNEFIKLKQVLSPEAISYMENVISAEVKRLNTQHLPMDQRDTYGKAFLQIMNLWTKSDLVKEIVFKIGRAHV